MKHLFLILLGITFATFAGVIITHAAETSYTPLAPLPGTYTGGVDSETTNLSLYLSGAIKLLIALGAGLSILVAIIGGTQYVAAGISPDAKSGAKERITNAFIGLALVLTSYLILNSINPKLVAFNFMLPEIEKSSVEPPPDDVCPSPNDTSVACCPTGIACQACSGCSLVTGVANKGCEASNCYLNTALLSKIQSVSVPGLLSWRITESWPPTVAHLSTCHQNGTCADLNNTGGSTQPEVIKILYDAFQAAGLNVTYESKDCAPYIAVGVTNCATYSLMTTESSYHVK